MNTPPSGVLLLNRTVIRAALLAVVMIVPAVAQSYPEKPLRLIVPFPGAGGGADFVGRVVGQKLAERLGQPVVIENRPGAAGNIGIDMAAKAQPDGHTLLIVTPSLTISPSLYKKLGYDPTKDLAPISLVSEVPNLFIVRPGLPVKTLGEFIDYARAGVWHIWIGFDHILFLLSLLLPAVLFLARERWQAVARFNPAFWDVFRIVTSFTVAHSITLSLATLGLIALPSRLVESAIAASVVLAALNNLYPLFQGRRWMVAFCFGLIHGFGFASVLADLGLPRGALALALVGFNLGVELGQLTIVAVFLPTAYLLRHGWFYRRLVFTGGSWLIALVAAIWLVERAFDLKLITA